MGVESEPGKIQIKELSTNLLSIKGLEITFGRLALEEEFEPLGPTPSPQLSTLRAWDRLLLSRYKPFYAPFCDLCCLCTYGKCDLTKGRRGSCGIDIRAQQARIVLIACCIGAATHTAHAKHMIEHLIRKFGEDYPINLGSEIELEAPHARLIMGIRPKTIGDLKYITEYCSNQITHALAAIHTGQEGDAVDFESKSLHVSMIDHLAMEAADIAQIVTFNFPKGDPDAPLVDLGLSVVDPAKPLALCIGHNVSSGIELIDFMEKEKLGPPGQVLEVAGLCCTAHDITRYSDQAKVIGPISSQIRYIRAGFADCIMVDEQCIHTDVVYEASQVNTPVVASSDKACYGLPDFTEQPLEAIVEALVSKKYPGVLILDPAKAGAVTVLTALRMNSIRKKFKIIPSINEIAKLAAPCTFCNSCQRNCPWSLPVGEAVNAARKGDLRMLAEIRDFCVGCIRCEQACQQGIPILSLMEAAAKHIIAKEKFKVRAGRGPILDTEIRKVGRDIVLGEIPGVIAFVGCANYPGPERDVGEMAYEFARRGYIVCTSGCAAMSAAKFLDEENRSPYESFPGVFDRGGIVNVGSCVANSHISAACIKIASIFARRKLRANYEEIADYILHRIGACGVAWGAFSQKAASIATGFNRLGVPVVLGPQGSKYRRLYLGRVEDRESFMVYDARTGDKVFIGPSPEHLIMAVETKEEAMIWIAKLCIRPNDTTKGRMIKLTHYADLYRKLYGRLPEDLPLLVRTEADIPITLKDEFLDFLKAKGWQLHPKPTVDPTLLSRMVYAKKV